MDALEQLSRELREFATEVHTLGYSTSVVAGAESHFFDLSDRMIRCADAARPALWRQSGSA